MFKYEKLLQREKNVCFVILWAEWEFVPQKYG